MVKTVATLSLSVGREALGTTWVAKRCIHCICIYVYSASTAESALPLLLSSPFLNRTRDQHIGARRGLASLSLESPAISSQMAPIQKVSVLQRGRAISGGLRACNMVWNPLIEFIQIHSYLWIKLPSLASAVEDASN